MLNENVARRGLMFALSSNTFGTFDRGMSLYTKIATKNA